MKDLETLSNEELRNFFNSFDLVLSDVDGVLGKLLETIPQANDAIRSLKKIGKQLALVTNNTTRNLEDWNSHLTNKGFEMEKVDVVTPIQVMISYLQKKNLHDKKIFVLSMPPLKEALTRAGFALAANGPDRIKNAFEFVTLGIAEDSSVAAVIVDADFNLNYLNLQKAATFLRNPDVLFLTGCADIRVPVGSKQTIIGPGNFTKILENSTGRIPILMAKPGRNMNDYLVEKFEIKNPDRVLFIGDSIPEDMGFATNSNYKKLLVLTGLATKESLEMWEFPEEFKPEFYVSSLGIVFDLLIKCGMIKE